MIWRIKSIIYIYILTCASFLPFLGASGYDLWRALGFEPVLTVGMLMGAHVGYPLGYSIKILVGLALVNSFGTWELYLVVIPLSTLDGLMIGAVELSLVGLSLGLPLGSPL